MASRADPSARQPGAAAVATNARLLEQLDCLREDLVPRDAESGEPGVPFERREVHRPSVFDHRQRP
jgi:hypothetical protein